MDAKEKKLAALVAVMILVVFTTTLLLDWPWIQARLIRQILIYGIIAFEVYVFAKNIYSVAIEKEL